MLEVLKLPDFINYPILGMQSRHSFRAASYSRSKVYVLVAGSFLADFSMWACVAGCEDRSLPLLTGVCPLVSARWRLPAGVYGNSVVMCLLLEISIQTDTAWRTESGNPVSDVAGENVSKFSELSLLAGVVGI